LAIEDIEKVACGVPCESECPVKDLEPSARFAVYLVIKNDRTPESALEFMGQDLSAAHLVEGAVRRIKANDCPHYDMKGENYGEDI
jgi:hypothetical protein